ncbi:MAG TPA: methyl-accepting chemotaxis protein, partial [Alphaproteobacteria bacterium]|nr:methyl-accepting chemotaxis protein [Alphaproteobacteria bacterium]
KAGQERANGAAGVSSGRFDPALYLRFAQIAAEQATYFRLFDGYASPDTHAFFGATMVGKPVEEVERIRGLILDGGLTGDLGGTEGPYWYEMTTARIDLMKQVEDHIAGELRAVSGDVSGAARMAFFAMLSTVAALLILTIVAGLLSVRSIAGPIVAMTGAMGRLASGDHATDIPGTGRRDEVGLMAKAVLVFKENMIRTKELAAQEAEAQQQREARARTIDTLTADFDQEASLVLKTVSSAATEMQTTAQSLTATAEETSRQSTAVAAASEQASTNVQTVASAAEELSSSIAEISRQVSQSAEIAGRAVTDAERTNVQVQGLAEAAQKIGEVVQLITDIASQTNLLALNATIEAARAGDAGKGFAVVASEVKNLANETAKATEEITGQITSIQAATRDAVTAIQSIGQTIGQINEIATTIASAVEEQGAATQEIARNVQQASAGTTEVSSNIAGVTQAAGETGAAATQMLSASGELARQGEHLRGEVDKFLQVVRAA